ncbi:MAG: hypothetical protein PHQ27_05750 [Victivallales bacterium]|nr:hypothetical protein [Victivallales bacterium]
MAEDASAVYGGFEKQRGVIIDRIEFGLARWFYVERKTVFGKIRLFLKKKKMNFPVKSIMSVKGVNTSLMAGVLFGATLLIFAG